MKMPSIRLSILILKMTAQKGGKKMKAIFKVLWLLLDVKGFCTSNYTEKELADMGIKF